MDKITVFLEVQDEIETANYYTNEIYKMVPKWLQIKSTFEVDEAIQEFASSFFSGLFH